MYARLEEMSAERPSLEQGIALCAQADVIVDGLYGIGFRGLSEKLLPLCRAAAASPARTFALDLPSGAQCDSGKLPGEVFRADVTVTFSTLKPVHVLYPSMDVCGKTLVRQVGIPERCSTKRTSHGGERSRLAGTLPAGEGPPPTRATSAACCACAAAAGWPAPR